MKKNLLVISNHDPAFWADEQRQGWDNIEYYPFPQVDPHASKEQIFDHVTKLSEEIGRFVNRCEGAKAKPFVSLQGESSVVYYTIISLFPYIQDGEFEFIFPTTERVVEEVVQPDGSTIKKSLFKFVRWR